MEKGSRNLPNQRKIGTRKCGREQKNSFRLVPAPVANSDGNESKMVGHPGGTVETPAARMPFSAVQASLWDRASQHGKRYLGILIDRMAGD
jgi:hypothetical protein